jgi:SagB-type dehydrogenase family enzyme
VSEPDPALAFHRLTRHGSPVDRWRLVDFRSLDPANRPAPFKRYVGRPTRPLPRDLRATGGGGVDDAELARLLFFSGGVTRVTDASVLETRTYFRAAMSAGNLHPVELYVVSGGVGDVPAGVHHYDPLGHGLTQLRAGDFRGVTLMLTGIPWRTAWKYGERGYRHLFWDAGAMVANLLAVAEADGVSARVVLGFADDEIAALLGVDGTTEFPLAIVMIGDTPPQWAPPRDEITFDVEPISAYPIEFPLIVETHRAGVLGRADVAAWRDAASVLGTPAGSDAAWPVDRPRIDEVILRRGSTRIMRREAAPRALLTQGMAEAARPVVGDFAAEGRTLLEHNLAVHGIEGVPPGAYTWRADRRELQALHLGDHRDETALLCLRQPLGGDSAYTAFHSADLGAVLGALGARGYRAAQFEAGVAAGRLSLAAFTLGYGATGLTFFDEAVSQFFGTAAACMLVTSVGVPDYRNTPGGPPGAATALEGYSRLMERLSRQLHQAR